MEDFASYPPIVSNRDSGIGVGLGGIRKLSTSSSGRFGGEDPLFDSNSTEPYGYGDVFFGGGPNIFGGSRRQSFSNQLYSDMLGVSRSASPPSPPPSSSCEPSVPPFPDAPIFDDDNLDMDHSGYQDVFSIGATPVFSSSPFGGGLETSDEERSRFSLQSDASSDVLNVEPHINELPNHRLAEDWKPPKQATSPEGTPENDNDDEFLVINFNRVVSNTSPTLFSDLDPFNAKSFPVNDNEEQIQSDRMQEEPPASFSDWEALIFNPFSSSSGGNNKQTHTDGAGEEGFLGFDDFVRLESSAKHSPVEEPNERSETNNPYRSSVQDHISPEQNVSDKSDQMSTEFGVNVAWQGRNRQSLAGEDCAPPKVFESVESNDFWVTVDMINLKTQSSRYPPPERCPPPCMPASGVGSKEAMNPQMELRPAHDNNIQADKAWEGRQGQSMREEVQAQGREEEDRERWQREWEEREQEMGRIAVDRASREARGRLEQAGVEAVRERVEHVMAEAKQRAQRTAVGRASAEARERAAEDANKRVQRAAVERATAEARERAMEEAWERAQRFAVERATAEARERAMEEARERAQRAAAERAAAEARERAMEEARERAQRAAAERAAAEARERAMEEARERAAAEARERAMEEARERAQRAAAERAAAEARERAMEEARERVQRVAVERAAAEARQRAAEEARERAQRVAVERAAAEARERAMEEAREKAKRLSVERAMAEARERAAAEARDRAAAATVAEAREGMERQQQKQSEIDLESFFMPSSRTQSSTPQQKSEAREFANDSFQSNKGTPRWASPGSSSATKSAPAVNFMDDLTSIFGPPDSKQFQEVKGEPDERSRARWERHQRTMERAEKALEEKNQRDLQMQWEQEERHRLGETVDIEIKRWATGKEGNIRAMLSTLQYVLWPECGWQPVSLMDLITAATVKKAYRKATLCIHPDKVQQKGATLQQKYIAEKVFDLLKEAWNKFNSEELF